MKQSKKEMIAVLEAAQEGKQIQATLHNGSGNFVSCDGPCWNFDMFEYRVKPEPKQCWVAFNEDGGVVNVTCNLPENSRFEYILMTEDMT